VVELKVLDMKDSDKLCILLVNELQLRTCSEFDKGLLPLCWLCSPDTLPTDAAPRIEKELVSHAMVFMLRGLIASWKQTVAYLLAGASVKHKQFWNFTKG
jgi:hypothetical protein